MCLWLCSGTTSEGIRIPTVSFTEDDINTTALLEFNAFLQKGKVERHTTGGTGRKRERQTRDIWVCGGTGVYALCQRLCKKYNSKMLMLSRCVGVSLIYERSSKRSERGWNKWIRTKLSLYYCQLWREKCLYLNNKILECKIYIIILMPCSVWCGYHSFTFYIFYISCVWAAVQLPLSYVKLSLPFYSETTYITNKQKKNRSHILHFQPTESTVYTTTTLNYHCTVKKCTTNHASWRDIPSLSFWTWGSCS